jgi:hypothetical protein
MLFFFLFLLHVAYDHQLRGGGPRGTPSVEAYCPFGGLETLYQFLTTGGFVRRIEPSALILFAALVLLTVLASRGFCGWICPFGSVQEWIGMLGRRILKKRFNPSGAWDRYLRYLKYVILAIIVMLTWHTGALVFRAYDPFLAFFHLGNGLKEMPWAYGILIVVLAGSLWIERFFCKYACPLGAVLGLLGRVGLTKIQRDPGDCKACNLCHKKCPAHIDFLSTTTIRDPECNLCMICIADCPKPTVLTVRASGLSLSHSIYAAVLVAGLLLLVGTSRLAGKWQTRPSMVSFTNSQGALDPEAIRGWMTMQEIGDAFGIPLSDLYRKSGLPLHVSSSSRLNAIARDYKLQFEPDKLREIVRTHRGKPEAPPLGSSAPKEFGKSAELTARSAGEPEVKGFMTLNEIAVKTGVPKHYLLQRLGLPPTIDPRIPVREWMHEKGKSVQDLREAVRQFHVKEGSGSR